MGSKRADFRRGKDGRRSFGSDIPLAQRGTAAAALAAGLVVTLLAVQVPSVAHGQGAALENVQDVWLIDAEGEKVSAVEALAPGPTLVIFWRLDSKPSREAVIHLHQNRLRLETKLSRMVTITDERREAAQDFLRSQGIRLPAFYDAERTLAAVYGVGYVFPALVLLDRDLSFLGREEGGGASFDAKLTRLLDESLPEGDESARAWIIAAVLAAAVVLGTMVSR